MATAKKKSAVGGKRKTTAKAKSPVRRKRIVSGIGAKKRRVGVKTHTVQRMEKTIEKLERLRAKCKTPEGKNAYARLINAEHDKIDQVGKIKR